MNNKNSRGQINMKKANLALVVSLMIGGLFLLLRKFWRRLKAYQATRDPFAGES